MPGVRTCVARCWKILRIISASAASIASSSVCADRCSAASAASVLTLPCREFSACGTGRRQEREKLTGQLFNRCVSADGSIMLQHCAKQKAVKDSSGIQTWNRADGSARTAQRRSRYTFGLLSCESLDNSHTAISQLGGMGSLLWRKLIPRALRTKSSSAHLRI